MERDFRYFSQIKSPIAHGLLRLSPFLPKNIISLHRLIQSGDIFCATLEILRMECRRDGQNPILEVGRALPLQYLPSGGYPHG